MLAGETAAKLSLSADAELYAALDGVPVVLEDSLPTSRYAAAPRALLSL
jgi:hypothetical protein